MVDDIRCTSFFGWVQRERDHEYCCVARAEMSHVDAPPVMLPDTFDTHGSKTFEMLLRRLPLVDIGCWVS